MTNQEPIPLMTRIKDKLSAEEFHELDAIMNKQVVALGEDQAFALRDEKGEIRAYKQRVRLSEADGTLVEIKRTWAVTAMGYERLAEASGTCVMLPKTLFVEGKDHSNPWVFRGTNYRIVTVYARAVAFRFSSKGLPMVSDWTTTYDSPNYRLIDLLAKAKDHKNQFMLLPNDMTPPDDGQPRAWAKYYFDPACNLWVDCMSQEALQWHSEIINREKKAMDYAQTFAKRNAVKHLLGIQKAPAGCKGVWDVTILCWRPVAGSLVTWDGRRYADVRDQVAALSDGGTFVLQPKVERGYEDSTPDPTIDAEIEGEGEFVEVEPEPLQGADSEPGQQPPVEVAPTPAPPPPAPPAPKPAPPPPLKQPPGKMRKEPAGPPLSDITRGKIANLNGMSQAYPEEWARAVKAVLGGAGQTPLALHHLPEEKLDQLNQAFSREIDAANAGAQEEK